ncbi:MAG: SDR family oxidoreductase [Rhodobacteraceae bacterium]|nr:SDR family oxidoreductase [Paracoccaceae bacterium]
MNRNWLIIGASSAMARAFSRRLASQGASVFLAGRDLDDLNRAAADLALRGAARAEALAFDAGKPEGFAPICDRLAAEDGELNVAVFIGSMPDQAEIDRHPALIEQTIQSNFTGPARFLQAFVPMMEERGGGTLVGVGSVAGDRGRIGNYVYGAAKAGFATYLAGLRNRLGRAGGHVVTVKPGFVDTAMTWGLPGMFLVAAPERVADDILTAVRKRRNVIYTPFFWRWIMLIIRLIPEAIFKKLSV